MTATLPARGADPLAVAAETAPKPGPMRRRSPAMVSLGIVLVVLCALAAWEYVSSTGPATRSYLAVYTDVPVGAEITADDLQVVSVTPVAGLTAVPADQESAVVGQYVTVPLLAGTLLAPTAIAPHRTIATGHALVGVSLSPDRRPARGLTPGDHVRLVEVPDPNGSDGTAAPTLPPLVVTVGYVGAVGDDGAQGIDLSVPLANVNTVAALSALDRIAVVLVNGV